MNKDRINYLLNTPRSQLSPSDKRLQTIVKKYGSVANSLKARDKGDLILGGINGGRKTGYKGYATWEEEDLKQFVKSRTRDERGRFLPKDSTL